MNVCMQIWNTDCCPIPTDQGSTDPFNLLTHIYEALRAMLCYHIVYNNTVDYITTELLPINVFYNSFLHFDITLILTLHNCSSGRVYDLLLLCLRK